jgi:thiol-disulfide isomerase/thioredoxin
LDISAQWCSPCRALEPILNEVVTAYSKDELLFTKLEAEDENMKILFKAAFVGASGVPRLVSKTPVFIKIFPYFD